MPPRRGRYMPSPSLTPEAPPRRSRRIASGGLEFKQDTTEPPPLEPLMELSPIEPPIELPEQALKISLVKPKDVEQLALSNNQICLRLQITEDTYIELQTLFGFLFCYHRTLGTLRLQRGTLKDRQQFCDILERYTGYISIKNTKNFRQHCKDDTEAAWCLYQMALNIRSDVREAQEMPEWRPTVKHWMIDQFENGTFPDLDEFDWDAVFPPVEDSPAANQLVDLTADSTSPEETPEPIESNQIMQEPVDEHVEENLYADPRDQFAPERLDNASLWPRLTRFWNYLPRPSFWRLLEYLCLAALFYYFMTTKKEDI
ncbi:hypothetical protein ABW21_db0202485 [Orbilia brochopaga]|nr:hypothetical protein ABW21_db0202485 [Drechslerella brochopaga]